MSEISNANITVNLGEGSFSISGSELFIEKNRDEVFKFLEKNNKSILKRVHMEDTSPAISRIQTEEIEQIENLDTSNVDKYISLGVYHVDPEDGMISILKKVPGNSKAEKAKNIALIVLYIKKERINSKLLIPLCEKHSCYDQGNFSTWFKTEKTNIIRKSSGQSWTIELTHPGEEAAIELLEGMINASK